MDPKPAAVPTDQEISVISRNRAGIESEVEPKSKPRGVIEAVQESVADLLGDNLKDKPDLGVVSNEKQEYQPPELVDQNASDSGNHSDDNEEQIEETPVSRYPMRSRSSPNRVNPTITGKCHGNSIEGVIYPQV